MKSPGQAALLPGASASNYGTMASRLDRYFDDEQYENAFWGALVIDLNTGDTLYTRNEKLSMMPASNNKLYTTAAALDLLGPDFRYETPYYTDGPVQNGVLRGNLIVRGSGDPSIGSRYDETDPTAAFRAIAGHLKSKGIRLIQGNVIGDDDLFDDDLLGVGWSWDDEPYYYSAQISPLSFYDNSVQFIQEGDRIGQPARLRWSPQTAYIDVVNKTVTVHPDSSFENEFERPPGTNRIAVHTEIEADRIDTTYIAVFNPTRYFVHILREVLIEEGISVRGDALDIDDLAIKPDYDSGTLVKLGSLTSPSLGVIIQTLNKESQNLYAELVLRTIGLHRPVADPDLEPGSAEMGVAASMETFVRARMDTSRIQMVDGSGLSRMNLVTPAMTGHLLKFMWTHPSASVRQAFYESLPIGGVDGTLEDRFKMGAGFRNVRAKTGTLTGASSLSGYVYSHAGTPLLFVLMCNNYTHKTSKVRNTQNEVVQMLAGLAR